MNVSMSVNCSTSNKRNAYETINKQYFAILNVNTGSILQYLESTSP